MSERVKRLEERGITAGYGARIDLAALGLHMMAIIRLRTAHEHIRACLKLFDELPFVIEVHRVTGEDCRAEGNRAGPRRSRRHSSTRSAASASSPPLRQCCAANRPSRSAAVC